MAIVYFTVEAILEAIYGANCGFAVVRKNSTLVKELVTMLPLYLLLSILADPMGTSLGTYQ